MICCAVLEPDVDGWLSGSGACHFLLLRFGNWKSASACVAVSISSLSGLSSLDVLMLLVSSSVTVSFLLRGSLSSDCLIPRCCCILE